MILQLKRKKIHTLVRVFEKIQQVFDLACKGEKKRLLRFEIKRGWKMNS